MSAPSDTAVEDHAKLEAEVAKPEPETSDSPPGPAADTVATEAPAPAETPAAPAALTEPTITPVLAPEPAAPPRQRELVADARLGVLRAMFPDFDDSLLQSVLDSVQGNTDRAIDALLGMSDPDYQGEPVPQQAQPQVSRLRVSHKQVVIPMNGLTTLGARKSSLSNRPQVQRRGYSDPPERDTMQELGEQFNKFAESGKKTIGSLFSKVKAKIQEFDQSMNQSPANATYGGVGGDTYPYDTNQNPYPSRQAAAAQRQAQAQMPAYYDPNAGDPQTYSPPGSASATAAGYDVGAPVSMGTPSPPNTNSGAPQIDAGKLGMLPKRPVSLLRTNPPPSSSTGAPPSSDDELEYAENPFEEGKK
ncbi:CUE domain-containing protein [Mycena sanguinolenta]|uniref:CUE domain-containing protein n=1 Tax=Mycena sanguinolenta TaxID=230812 RepID=A0A8H6ZCQ9_9AGAR|nr:CUE domain-containing protein [Mycena sanguinolenta]